MDVNANQGRAKMAKAKLIVIKVEDKPGAVAAAVAVLSAAKVNIEVIFGYGPQGDLQLVVDNPRKAMKALKAAGVAFSEGKAEVVKMPNKPGSLHNYLSKLAKKGVNLRSISGMSGKSARKSILVWTAD
jgi:hypothetical protein